MNASNAVAVSMFVYIAVASAVKSLSVGGSGGSSAKSWSRTVVMHPVFTGMQPFIPIATFLPVNFMTARRPPRNQTASMTVPFNQALMEIAHLDGRATLHMTHPQSVNNQQVFPSN